MHTGEERAQLLLARAPLHGGVVHPHLVAQTGQLAAQRHSVLDVVAVGGHHLFARDVEEEPSRHVDHGADALAELSPEHRDVVEQQPPVGMGAQIVEGATEAAQLVGQAVADGLEQGRDLLELTLRRVGLGGGRFRGTAPELFDPGIELVVERLRLGDLDREEGAHALEEGAHAVGGVLDGGRQRVPETFALRELVDLVVREVQIAEHVDRRGRREEEQLELRPVLAPRDLVQHVAESRGEVGGYDLVGHGVSSLPGLQWLE